MFRLRLNLNQDYAQKQSKFKQSPSEKGKQALDGLQGHIEALSMKIFKSEVETYNSLIEPVKTHISNLFKFQWKLEGEKVNSWHVCFDYLFGHRKNAES